MTFPYFENLKIKLMIFAYQKKILTWNENMNILPT